MDDQFESQKFITYLVGHIISMMLFAPFTRSVIFGIDFGSEYIKTGMAMMGKGIHVAINQQSKRLSPSYFAFWNKSNPRVPINATHLSVSDLDDCDWSYQDTAKSHSMRYPAQALKGMGDLLTSENGFTRRETLALQVRNLIKTTDRGQWKPENAEVVFAVEPFLKRDQRAAIQEAVALANATLEAIVDGPTASAQVYALEKRYLYEKSPKTVAFLDIGAGATWLAIFNFKIERDTPIVSELALVRNMSLGGNIIDQKIADLLIDDFKSKNKITEDLSDRSIRRVLEDSRRAKEFLSINTEKIISIDDVVGDDGIEYELKREQIATLIPEFNESLQHLYQSALDQANLKASDIDSVELIGGTTRVQYIQQVLKEISGLERLNRTMNSDEAVALGCGYVGASHSSVFIVKKVQMRPFCNTNVSVIMNGKETKLFNEYSRLDETANITFTAEENAEFTIYADGIEMATFNLSLPEDLNDGTEVRVTFGFNHFTQPNVTKITVGGAELSASNYTCINPEWRLSPEQIEESLSIIKRMDEILNERREYQKVINDYEAFIYKVQDRLQDDEKLKEVQTPEDREKLVQMANEHRAWLNEDHSREHLTIEDVNKRCEEINNTIIECDRRAKELVERPKSFAALKSIIDKLRDALVNKWPAEKSWLNATHVHNVWGSFNRTEEWYNDKMEECENLSATENPPVYHEDIDNQKFVLEWYYNNTNKMRRPTPKPTPKPITPTPVPPISVDGEEEDEDDEL